MKPYISIPLLILAFTFVFALSAFGQTSGSVHLALGNPSNAKTDLNRPDNYLVVHQGFALSYSKERGAANWIAWHLEKSNIGKAERTNAFAPDTTLPREWWILPTDYTGSGYDRGHMCPSKDRSDTEESNQETFLMSNMQPQAPKLNQQTWKYLEDYTREAVGKGNEAYIYAGCYGDKGKLKNKVTIPTSCFRVIVILSEGENDLKRIDKTTRVIAVDMPNDQSVSIRWRTYLTTVDEIENKTGFDFLTNVPKKIQKVIESKKDEQSAESQKSETDSPIVKNDVKGSNSSGRVYRLGVRGGCYYLTESGKKSYVDKKFCEGVPTATTTGESGNKESSPKTGDTTLPKTSTKNNSSREREYHLGSRGGCYYLTESGVKKYVDKKYCARTTELKTGEPEVNEDKETEAETKPADKPESKDRTYTKGARGGCYYINSSGKKVYVDKSLCN